jgi:hypothetical protein
MTHVDLGTDSTLLVESDSILRCCRKEHNTKGDKNLTSPAGIEPTLLAPEANALSAELRGHLLLESYH